MSVKTKKERKLVATNNTVLETEHRGVAFCARGAHGSLVTKRGLYVLKKHTVHNIYTGVARGIKVHVSLKVKSEILIFWA